MTGTGNITFYRREGTGHAVYPLIMKNGLWYNETTVFSSATSSHLSSQIPSTTSPTVAHARVHRLSEDARYEFLHQVLAHPGEKRQRILHKHIDGITKPLKGNLFRQCPSCFNGKPKKGISRLKHGQQPSSNSSIPTSTDSSTIFSNTTSPHNDLHYVADYLDLVSPISNGDALQILARCFM